MNSDEFLEKYPIKKALYMDIESRINKDVKYISLKRDVCAYGNFIYPHNLDDIVISYGLYNSRKNIKKYSITL